MTPALRIAILGLVLSFTSYGCAQEVLWSDKGIGKRPHITFLEGKKSQLVMITSPFSGRAEALSLADGQRAWKRTFAERIPYSPLPLTENVLIQGDQGTIWALWNKTGFTLWEKREEEAIDYPMAPPQFRAESVFSLSRRGILRKVDRDGKVVARVELDTAWGERKARTVPFRTTQVLLQYLDQSGRLTSFIPDKMTSKVSELWKNGLSAERTYGRTREVLAGAISSKGSIVWTVELPGFMRSTQLAEEPLELWSRRFRTDGDLWSADGNFLAIPTLLEWSGRGALMVCTRNRVIVFDKERGEVLVDRKLPSEAVDSPTFDPETKSWWLLCSGHFIRFQNDDLNKNLEVFESPLVDQVYTMKVKGNFAVVTSLEGRVFGVTLQSRTEVEFKRGS